MQTSRRTFLKQSALALAGTSILSPSLAEAAKPKEWIGLQLYSVRREMNIDPRGTLSQLAEMGFQNVEHSNYSDRRFYGFAVQEFKKILSDQGLRMPCGHSILGRPHWDESKKDFTDSWKYTVDDAAQVGEQFMISSWIDESFRKTYDDLRRFMEVFNKCGELCIKSGMKFGYHNHDYEFSQKLNAMPIYDIILQNTDPKLVTQQLDIGNLYNGGAKALDIIKRYPGRFELIHVKDEIPTKEGTEKFESTILGTGVVNVKEVIDSIRSSGTAKAFIIEQDSYQAKTPMAAVQEDLYTMKKWGY